MTFMQNNNQTLKGFRDFLPQEKQSRDFVLRQIISTFEKYGFEPIETPTLEYASLLLGKYGDEADKLVYTFTDNGGRKVGLRYDQTVPSARLLNQYANQLPKYFRRYQIQSVFRADKPQKGRYREFTQCDIDIFGSSSSLADAEIISCTYEAFKKVGYPNIKIQINDRQVLIKNLQAFSNSSVSVLSIIQSIDKLDKLSSEKVIKELVNKGISQDSAKSALSAITNAKPSAALKNVIESSIKLGVPTEVLEFNSALARGLDYYTGTIFEVVIPDYPVGSFGGGGRYDNLIGDIGGTNIPAVGISFGLDRMVEAAQNMGLIPDKNFGPQVLVALFPGNQKESLSLAKSLRSKGIKTEMYLTEDNLQKQFKFANKKSTPYVALVGPDESKNNTVTLKNMATGKQQTLNLNKVISLLQKG